MECGQAINADVRVEVDWSGKNVNIIQTRKRNQRHALNPGVTQAPPASTMRTSRSGARGTCPTALTIPLSNKRSPYITSVPFFCPVQMVAFLMRVAGVPSSNLSETLLSTKFKGGPDFILREAHRVRISWASSGMR